MALLFAALSIGSNLRFLPRMHIPISYAFMPPGFHLAAALLLGITAGFREEVLFRAFLMTEFANAGYGKVMQVLMPGAHPFFQQPDFLKRWADHLTLNHSPLSASSASADAELTGWAGGTTPRPYLRT
jgi:hypothetical protein